jgi:hypothetical protein
MHGVHAEISLPTLWIGFAPFSDRHLRGLRRLIRDPAVTVARGKLLKQLLWFERKRQTQLERSVWRSEFTNRVNVSLRSSRFDTKTMESVSSRAKAASNHAHPL